MRRAIVTGILATCLVAATVISAPAARAEGLQGCVDQNTYVGTAVIDKTCLGVDGWIVSLWLEGTNLNQELTALGDITITYGGIPFVVQLEAGTKMIDATTWEAYFQVNSPIAYGPWTMPAEVLADGTKVTIWWDLTQFSLGGFGGLNGADGFSPQLQTNVTVRVRDANGNIATVPQVSLANSNDPTPQMPGAPIQTTGTPDPEPVTAAPPANSTPAAGNSAAPTPADPAAAAATAPAAGAAPAATAPAAPPPSADFANSRLIRF